MILFVLMLPCWLIAPFVYWWITFPFAFMLVILIKRSLESPCDLYFMEDYLLRDAPFAVGLRYTRVTDKRLEATVYYPVEKDDVRGKDYTASWYPSYKSPELIVKTMRRMQLAQLVHAVELKDKIRFTTEDALPASLRYAPKMTPDAACRPDTQVKIPAFFEAPPAEKELRPVIFSHGLSASNTLYSGVCIALAARGYLVVAINHQDKSCFHTYDGRNNDAEMFFEFTEIHSAELRPRQLQIRVDEVISVMDLIKSE